jgi:hypothetical protein
MKKQFTKTWEKPVPVALPITHKELSLLGVRNPGTGEIRGALRTSGPWRIPVSYRALAMSTVYTPDEQRRYSAEQEKTVALGMRTMSNCKESGYALEGRTSIAGKKYRSFTSSQLFKFPDGKLVDIAIIFVCMK